MGRRKAIRQEDENGHWFGGGGDAYEFVRRVGVRGLNVCCLCGTLHGVQRTCRGNVAYDDFIAQVKHDLDEYGLPEQAQQEGGSG